MATKLTDTDKLAQETEKNAGLLAKLEGARVERKETEQINNVLATRVARLEGELEQVTAERDDISESSSEKIRRLQEELEELVGARDRAVRAEDALDAATARADQAEAALAANKDSEQSTISSLRNEVKTWQTKVFAFREAVKGL